MLTRAEIDDILKLIDGSEFTELRLELCKGGTAQPFHLGPNTQSGMQASRDAGGSQPWTPAPPAAVAAPIIASGDGSEIPAPFLGTFWHAPRPGVDPYVQPGDTVTADTIIDTTLRDGNRSNWGAGDAAEPRGGGSNPVVEARQGVGGEAAYGLA